MRKFTANNFWQLRNHSVALKLYNCGQINCLQLPCFILVFSLVLAYFLRFYITRSMSQIPVATELVLVGDSITGWFQTDGKIHYNRHFLRWKPINVGVAGDTTDQTIKRLHTGLLDGIGSSKVTTLMIGTNDIGWGHSPERIYNQIGTIIEILQDKLPSTKILLLGVLPASTSQTFKDVNTLIEKYSNGNSIRFLDMSKHFTTNDKILPSLYKLDRLHLSAEGYRVFAETMYPIVEDMINHFT